jgi:hypothetical protein
VLARSVDKRRPPLAMRRASIPLSVYSGLRQLRFSPQLARSGASPIHFTDYQLYDNLNKIVL